MSTGQQTPGTISLLKHHESLSLLKSSNNCGQLLRSWHLPDPPSAVVHTDKEDSSLLSLFISSSTDCCCWIDGVCVEDVIVCLSGNATPRTKGAILSVTLRPGKKIQGIRICKVQYMFVYVQKCICKKILELFNSMIFMW